MKVLDDDDIRTMRTSYCVDSDGSDVDVIAALDELEALRKVAACARRLLFDSTEIPDGGKEATCALEAALMEAGR